MPARYLTLQNLVQAFLRHRFPGFNANVSAYPSHSNEEILILVEGPWGNVQVSMPKLDFYFLFTLTQGLENQPIFQKIQQAIQPFYEKVMVQTSWERLLGEDPFQPGDSVAQETEPTEGHTALDRVLSDYLDQADDRSHASAESTASVGNSRL